MNPKTKTRFAIRFLVAMKKLHNKTPSSTADKYKRVRAAASASMASAVGPTRAWSLAVLRKVKRHKQHRYRRLMNKGRRRRNPRENLGFGEGQDLRSVVPGGKGMGFCSLLGETAHYIKCLEAQVQVMRTILDHFST